MLNEATLIRTCKLIMRGGPNRGALEIPIHPGPGESWDALMLWGALMLWDALGKSIPGPGESWDGLMLWGTLMPVML